MQGRRPVRWVHGRRREREHVGIEPEDLAPPRLSFLLWHGPETHAQRHLDEQLRKARLQDEKRKKQAKLDAHQREAQKKGTR